MFAADGASVNNLLGYTGIFRGALVAGASVINLERPRGLAGLTVEAELVPDVLDCDVHDTVSAAVRQAAADPVIRGSAPNP